MTDQQLTLGDLEQMAAAGDDDGIAKAKAEGRLNVLLGMELKDAELVERATTEPIDSADVQTLARLHQYDLIATAQREGRINHTKENQ